MGTPREDAERIEALTASIDKLTGKLEKTVGNTGTATVKIGDSFKSGMIVGICAATCIATWIGLILISMEIHDLRAWRDIHQNHISVIESQLKKDH